jgi:hypothetical protein
MAGQGRPLLRGGLCHGVTGHGVTREMSDEWHLCAWVQFPTRPTTAHSLGVTCLFRGPLHVAPDKYKRWLTCPFALVHWVFAGKVQSSTEASSCNVSVWGLDQQGREPCVRPGVRH